MPALGEPHDVLPKKSPSTDHKQFLSRHLAPYPKSLSNSYLVKSGANKRLQKPRLTHFKSWGARGSESPERPRFVA